MKRSFLSILLTITVMYSFAQIDSTALNNVFGKKGSVQGNVYKITYPRYDLKVKIGDFSVAPGLALGSWVGILKMGNESMMMGDLVILDSEVSKVITKLVEENLEVTAIHNH